MDPESQELLKSLRIREMSREDLWRLYVALPGTLSMRLFAIVTAARNDERESWLDSSAKHHKRELVGGWEARDGS